jgi:antitoxin CcdA
VIRLVSPAPRPYRQASTHPRPLPQAGGERHAIACDGDAMRIVYAPVPVEADVNAETKVRSSEKRRPTNVSLDIALVEAAREKGINISRASEAGLREALARRWREDNAQAIEAYNAHVAEHGLPLPSFRQV